MKTPNWIKKWFTLSVTEDVLKDVLNSVLDERLGKGISKDGKTLETHLTEIRNEITDSSRETNSWLYSFCKNRNHRQGGFVEKVREDADGIYEQMEKTGTSRIRDINDGMFH